MTREELREHCERQIQQFERVEKIMPVTLNDLKRYEEHKLILELLEQTQWIPVSEKLPNFNDIVLASTDSDYDELRVILTVYNGEEFWFNGKIKAWMPLPEPYKAEGRG